MADVQITITIPDAHVARTIEAFSGVAGANISMIAYGKETNFNGRWDFAIAPKDAGETQLDFGKRVFRELGLALIRMWDYAQDGERYKTEVQTITPVQQDVPDGILT